MKEDSINRYAALEAIMSKPAWHGSDGSYYHASDIRQALEELPSEQPEIIRCKDCKWWRQQTNYQGTPLSFGFCESDDMWRSLYGETYEVEHIDTDDDFYCGYAVRGNQDE